MRDYTGIIETLRNIAINKPGGKKRHTRGITTRGFDRINKLKERIRERKQQKELDG